MVHCWLCNFDEKFDRTLTLFSKFVCVYFAMLNCGAFAVMISAVPTKRRSSRYVKGLMIGAMTMLGLAIIVLLLFLWVRLLSKKERAAKRYSEVRKQKVHEASKLRCLEILSVM